MERRGHWILDIMMGLGERTEELTLSCYPNKRMKYPSWVLIIPDGFTFT
jgi:hypothetical protein